MPVKYSLEAKASALDLIHEKGGDVPLVSFLTGISERTLYTWRKQEAFTNGYFETEAPQPKHWLRQQPDYQERFLQRRASLRAVKTAAAE